MCHHVPMGVFGLFTSCFKSLLPILNSPVQYTGQFHQNWSIGAFLERNINKLQMGFRTGFHHIDTEAAEIYKAQSIYRRHLVKAKATFSNMSPMGLDVHTLNRVCYGRVPTHLIH